MSCSPTGSTSLSIRRAMTPSGSLVLGILVVLGMIYVESKIGDAKTKTHLIMASASTMVFAFHFHEHATASRMVKPALDSLILAVLTGGIGGTMVVRGRPSSLGSRQDQTRQTTTKRRARTAKSSPCLW
jgi:hypothetical protein